MTHVGAWPSRGAAPLRREAARALGPQAKCEFEIGKIKLGSTALAAPSADSFSCRRGHLDAVVDHDSAEVHCLAASYVPTEFCHDEDAQTLGRNITKYDVFCEVYTGL